MKQIIKVKVLTPGCEPVINKKGDWIDLKSAVDLEINAPQAGSRYKREDRSYRDVKNKVVYIPLGVAMQLPKGYEAIIASRSSTPYKKNIFIPNGVGIVDSVFCGDNDQWHYVASPLSNATIEKGDRICQFRIQLSQKATFWQKLKWLFSSGVEIKIVDSLSNPDRGGLGSTGVS